MESIIFDSNKETIDEFCDRLNKLIDDVVDNIKDPIFKAKMWRLMIGIRREQSTIKDPLSRAQVAFNKLAAHIADNV